MQSLKELYKIGNGPSSSHTMGPKRAVKLFKNTYKEVDKFIVYLYGSLASTGKGHLTDYIIKETLKPIKVDIIFDTKFKCEVHPNTMDIIAYKSNNEIAKWRVYSVGGGSIRIEGEKKQKIPNIYKLHTLKGIKKYCIEKNMTLYDYVYEVEGIKIKKYLKDIWQAMKNAVEQGIKTEGVIPGKLKIKRKAKYLYQNSSNIIDKQGSRTSLISSYAYAVSETNASGGVIVTAPTCGASGVLPAVLYYLQKEYKYTDEEIINSLAVAGLIGNLVKTNASISGAECGCQAEVGTACSMAAAACAQLMDLNLNKIEIAAEIAMEHHLGLTCDPIYGYVQIPCIERNAVAALRAIDAANLSKILQEEAKISFDLVVKTMYETGKDLSSHYRETSKGGLAKKYCRNKFYNTEIEM